MKLFITSFIFLVCFVQADAQFSLKKKYDTDLLLAALKTEKSDSVKARIYYLVSQHYSLVDDTVQGRAYLVKAAALNKRYPYLREIYPYYEAYVVWYDIEKSERLFLEAEDNLKKYTTSEAFFLSAKAWRNYGIHQQEKDDDKGFVEAVLKAIPYSKKSGDSATTGLLYQDIATVFMNEDQYEAAGRNYKLTIEYYKGSGISDEDLAYVYVLVSKNIALGKIEPDYPLARAYLDSAYNLLKSVPPPVGILDYYQVEGMYYYVTKQYRGSIKSLDKGLALSGKINSPYAAKYITDLKYQKYFSYYAMHEYKKALDILLGYMRERPVLSIRNRIRLYGDLSNTYSAMGNKASAFEWTEKYAVLSDSIHKVQLKEKISEMAIKFDASEKEKQILILRSEKDKALLTAQNRRTTSWMLGMASLLLLLILISGFIFYRYNKRNIAQKEAVNITQTMLNAQEDERARIARDLHDGLGGTLSGIKMNLALLSDGNNDDNTKAALQSITGQLGNSIQELRHIAHNMMPEMLLRLGLEAALKDLCHFYKSSGLDIHYQFINIQNTIPTQKQVIIYRIVQELFTNIARHAGAHTVFLQCSQEADAFFITVEDDGKGFADLQQQKSKGIGLKNIEHRVDYLNGNMEIISPFGKQGASINIQLDVRK